MILSPTTLVTGALARETRTIPIVFVNVGDPIASGFAASLARPGGNITGFTVETPAQGGKWVELLKEIAPLTVRMALLFNPATAVPLQFFMPSIQAAVSGVKRTSSGLGRMSAFDPKLNSLIGDRDLQKNGAQVNNS